MNDKMSKEDTDKSLKQNDQNVLTVSAEEIDTLGEIGNIFMGSASTTLSTLLDNKVEITTPQVEEFNKLDESYITDEDKIIIEIKYTKGLQGTVVFALKKNDAAVISDLMMGEKVEINKAETEVEIDELQLSALGEAMNQMIGTASTALSSMLNSTIGISHPEIKLMEKDKKIELSQDLLTKSIVTLKFNLLIGDLVNSEIIQFMSVEEAKLQVTEVTNMMQNMSQNSNQNAQSQSAVDTLIKKQEEPAAVASQPVASQPAASKTEQKLTTVQPVEFASFDNTSNISGEINKNLKLVMDVKLGLTVELGRTELPIKNVLELTKGSIIELNKIAGEPVELYANGKLIAKGEVVVIEDNFGLRIVSIISPENRIKEL